MAKESVIGSYRRRTPVLQVLHYKGNFPLDFLSDDEQVRFAGSGFENGDIHIEAATRNTVFAAVGYTLVREAYGGLTTYPVPAQFEAEFVEATDATG